MGSLMRNLYTEYENALLLKDPFNLAHEMDIRDQPKPTQTPLTTQQIVQQMMQMAQNGIMMGQGGISEEQIVRLAAAMLPYVNAAAVPDPKIRLEGILGAYIESPARTDVFKTDLRIERSIMATTSGPQEVIKHEVLWQRWEQEK